MGLFEITYVGVVRRMIKIILDVISLEQRLDACATGILSPRLCPVDWRGGLQDGHLVAGCRLRVVVSAVARWLNCARCLNSHVFNLLHTKIFYV